MARSANEYKQQYQALLPPGKLWDSLRRPGCVADKLMAAQAEEFARIDRRADDLLRETSPMTTMELLPEWEAWAGFPDRCIGDLETIEQRRNALAQRLTSVGGQSRAYFVRVAAVMGFDVAIEEFAAFTCESGCNEPICDETWRFTWRVRAPETTIISSTCESGCNEPLRSWGNEMLECVIKKLKPAHTSVLFGYGD